ncbi:NAD(P)-dependent oxidoreductase [Actinomycetospora straminea]|uniref:NAD(P)H-binding protein n=1 Tax=Actinomycetospora straminea TaxID=663607 RepID=A0ABP9EJI5_9PSEU|nr:NAD(P)H-binding protein [Actinomycetospora straminea]MDD7933258.1 NAD(P)H-binding protein [Actinomycetospora straminea]
MSVPRHVLVLGAGGGSGRQVVSAALRAGHRVTAGVRDPDRFRALGLGADLDEDRRPVVARVDVRDGESLAPAVEGQDVVVFAAGPPGRRAEALYSDGARATVAAMERCGVERFIGITSAGVRDDDPELALWYRVLVRPLLRELYADMRAMERTVRASSLDWTFVRPVLLLDRDPTGTYRVLDGTTPARGRTITRADLAAFVVGEVDRPRWSRRSPTLAQ